MLEGLAHHDERKRVNQHGQKPLLANPRIWLEVTAGLLYRLHLLNLLMRLLSAGVGECVKDTRSRFDSTILDLPIIESLPDVLAAVPYPDIQLIVVDGTELPPMHSGCEGTLMPPRCSRCGHGAEQG
jgi:hypothetical protein